MGTTSTQTRLLPYRFLCKGMQGKKLDKMLQESLTSIIIALVSMLSVVMVLQAAVYFLFYGKLRQISLDSQHFT